MKYMSYILGIVPTIISNNKVDKITELNILFHLISQSYVGII